MTKYFISDLHLSPEYPRVTEAFVHFLKTTAQGAESLYILGDLFDTWVGDDDDTLDFLKVAEAINEYQYQGTRCYFMHGNRDFLLGQQFAANCGMVLMNDPTTITLDQGPTLLMHGDTLCTKDQDYLAFRQMVRNPQWQETTLAKPLAERKALASHLRSTSQSMNSLKSEDIMDVTPDEVLKVMKQYNIPLLIHGHTHRPGRHQLILDNKPAERIVLGDWHDQGWYLVADDQRLELLSFPIN